MFDYLLTLSFSLCQENKPPAYLLALPLPLPLPLPLRAPLRGR